MPSSTRGSRESIALHVPNRNVHQAIGNLLSYGTVESEVGEDGD
jgi:hypothetical protein